jgi:hypothetical protein
MMIQLDSYLTLATDGDKWWVLCPGHFTLTESPQYPLKRRIGGPLRQSKRCREEKDLSPLPGITLQFLGTSNPACSLVTSPTKLSWKIQIIVFWVRAPSRLVGAYQCSTGPECSFSGWHEGTGNVFIQTVLVPYRTTWWYGPDHNTKSESGFVVGI